TVLGRMIAVRRGGASAPAIWGTKGNMNSTTRPAAHTNGEPIGHERTTPARSRWWAALRQRCPHCRTGRIFSGWLQMNALCPVCGLRFEREPGYFLGAMYFSYPLSIPILGFLMLALHLLFPEMRFEFVAGLATLGFIPFVPAV